MMYYSKNIKNLLFDLRSDVNFTAWFIITLLKLLDCKNKKKSLKDYRKVSLILEFIFDSDDSLDIFICLLKKEELSLSELQTIRGLSSKVCKLFIVNIC